MHRIFFYKNAENKPDPDELKVVNRHFELYGKRGSVHVFNLYSIPPYQIHDYLKIYLTDSENEISWEIKTNLDAIEEIEIKSDKLYQGTLLKHFYKLENENKACQKVTKEQLEEWEINNNNT